MAYEKIRYDVGAGGAATVTLDDPVTRNALGERTLDELIAALEVAREDDAVRCVVLASSHETVFSAGGDLAGFAAEESLVDKHRGTGAFVRLFRLIGELGKPTLCAANGHVLAGSLGLALACDLVVASEDARFGTPEIDVGVFPFIIMALIYRNVPRKKANEMLLLGEPLTARQACEAGIVNKVVPAERFETEVADWAGKLAAKPPLMMRLGKDAMFRSQDMPLLEALDYLHHNLTLALSTEDAKEGARAFLEQREPVWRNR